MRPPNRSSVADHAFRDAMASLPTGVAVVTAWADPREPRGATVSAVCSLSAEPPLLLACLGNDSDTGKALAVGMPFLVNVLAEEQREVARMFAVKDPGKFAKVRWKAGLEGLPEIEGSAAAVACETVSRIPGGDHTIVVGRICSTAIADGGGPLVYWRREFRHLREAPC